jgi:hypothetical protein
MIGTQTKQTARQTYKVQVAGLPQQNYFQLLRAQ